MLDGVPTELLFLVSLGLGLLLVILRFDAERFGAAEYDELVDGVRPPLRRRLAWYLVGIGLILAIMFIAPDPESDFHLTLGDRVQAIALGFAYGVVGTLQALAYAMVRYRRIRFPDVGSYPTSLINAGLDGVHRRGDLPRRRPRLPAPDRDGAVDRHRRPDPPVHPGDADGRAGRVPYMLFLSLGIGLVGGWLTVATGAIGAAFIGHTITRFSVFLVTGHAGQVAARGTEEEEQLRRRLIPEGWRIIGSRDGREAPSRDR